MRRNTTGPNSIYAELLQEIAEEADARRRAGRNVGCGHRLAGPPRHIEGGREGSVVHAGEPTIQTLKLPLRAHAAVEIVCSDGTPLVRIQQTADGAKVTLLGDDAEVSLPGRLRVTAAALELRARNGDVRIEANDRVVVVGETIDLN